MTRKGIGNVLPTVLLVAVAGTVLLGAASGPVLDMIGLGNATLFGFGDTSGDIDTPDTGDGGEDGSGGGGEENQNPSAEFTYSPSDPSTGESISFDASASSDPDGSIQSYEWDWTTDETYDDSGETATHSYENDGSYVVTLKVTDDEGATAKASKDIAVAYSPDDGDDGDNTCDTSTCGSWSDASCGAGSCGDGMMQQTRSCSDSDCGSSDTTRCVSDSSCSENSCPSTCSVRLYNEDDGWSSGASSRLVQTGVREFTNDKESGSYFYAKSYSDLEDGCSLWISTTDVDDPIGAGQAFTASQSNDPNHAARDVGVAPTDPACGRYADSRPYVHYWWGQGVWGDRIDIHVDVANNGESTSRFRITVIDENGDVDSVYPGSDSWHSIDSRETWYKIHKSNQGNYDRFTIQVEEEGEGVIWDHTYNPNIN